MLIDELNREGEKEQLFPFDLNFPLVMFEKFGITYIGSLVDFGNGYWMLSPNIYKEQKDDALYFPCQISFRITEGDWIEKVSISDEIRLTAKRAEFNVGMINGIPFSFETRIH